MSPADPGGSDRPHAGGRTVPFLNTMRGVARAVAIPRLELEVEREAGGSSGRKLVLEGDLFRVGSHASNDLALSDPQVSRFHCRLTRGESGWTITDNDSLNGTRVNGVRVREADLPTPSCRIEIGDSLVRVRELGSEAIAEVPDWSSFGELHGESLVMRRLFGTLNKVAQSDTTVLLEGESGTGKELAATELVRRGARADKPFLIIDCSAISPNLIESELFGHTRGAFTGADRMRMGAFEAANGGTVFLDEIGEMPLEMQPKFLRTLEAREIRRMGENDPRKIDVRVIAATHRRLEREVNSGRFREDLYFRLSVVTLRLPPLRKRLSDVPLLVKALLKSMNTEDAAHLFTPEVLADMQRHDWPGNVRELRNYVERTVVLERAAPASSPRGTLSSLPPGGLHADDAPLLRTAPDLELSFKDAKERVVTDFERNYLAALLEWADGNVSRAARKAKMDRMYLYRLLQRHDLRGGSIKD